MNATIPIRLDTNSVIGKNTTSSTLTFSDLLLNHGSTNTAAVYMIRKDNPNIRELTTYPLLCLKFIFDTSTEISHLSATQ
jgi:hypothetical protein